MNDITIRVVSVRNNRKTSVERTVKMHTAGGINKGAAAPSSSQAAQYNCGVLLHNWFEDRFAPKAGALADVYPMPPSTYCADFTAKTTPIRPMLRTGDVGKEILFNQGSLEGTAMASVTYSKYDKKKQEWSEMRDPELAGHLVTTKAAVEAQMLKCASSSAASSATNFSASRKSTFTKSRLTDHENMGLRE